jgi:hypothetical protein
MSCCKRCIQRHQKIDAAQGLTRNAVDVFLKGGVAGSLLDQERRSSWRSPSVVGERNFLGVRLKEEIEGIDHRHLGDQIDLDPELAGFLREHQARQVIALRVLLPVDEVLFPDRPSGNRKECASG